MNEHNLEEEHPPFCAPCAVTIYDRDCLMDEDATWVSWTANLTAEKVLVVLQRAEAEVRRHLETQLQTIPADGPGNVPPKEGDDRDSRRD